MKPTAATVALITTMLPACQPAAPGDASSDASLGGHENVLIDLWAQGLATFGVYVPNENPPTPEQRRTRERPTPVYTRAGGEGLAQNPLYDFVFLNLEGNYNVGGCRGDFRGPREPHGGEPEDAARPHTADREGWGGRRQDTGEGNHGARR